MRNFREKISGFFWLVIAIYVCFESVGTGVGTFRDPGPGFLPFLSALILGTLAIIVMAGRIFKGAEAPNLADLWKEKNWIRAILIIVLLSLYPILLPSRWS